MHVEPVVWLSARKDLLSGLFYILTIWAYAAHAQRSGWWRYLVLWAAFLAANMAKPMAVSLPFVLLLLDFWPLRRVEPGKKGWRRQIARAVWEKLGFIVVSVAVGLLAYLVQKHIGAVADDALLPLGWRIAAAAVAGITYVFKAFVPIELALFYPHPGRALSLIGAVGSGLLLLTISVAALRQHARRPWLTVGWFWFLVVIAPVSGIIQVGDQMMADRYSYLAFVGLFLAAVWQVAEWAAPRAEKGNYLSPRGARLLGAGVLGVFTVAAAMQVQTWKSSEAVFTHAIEVTENNHVAHFNLGATIWEQDPTRRDEALAHMREAGRIRRPFLDYQLRAADEALARGALGEAIPRFVRVLMLTPWDTDLRQRLASTLVRHREPGKALVQFNEALRYQPRLIPPRLSIAEILIAHDQQARAERVLRDVLSIDPRNGEALALLASLPPTEGNQAAGDRRGH
jgi:tetratricopeptide (TPR) repeat protein